jgi:hypothetical protein
MKYWEVIADNLGKAGWSLGCESAIDCEGRTIWIVDAHRDDGRRFIVHADDKLSAFVELKRVSRESLLSKCRIIPHNSRHAAFYPLCSSRGH